MFTLDHHKNIIEVQGVSFAYGQEKILDQITFNVHAGDYLGLVGPNGAGKTTLLKIILGLLPPLSGSIKLFGQDISQFKDWSKIAYVPQKVTNFDPNFPATVLEVVLMGRYARRGLGRRLKPADRQVSQQALQQVNLADYSSRLIGDLSGGQQQRVFIARALASQPEVIFLDEPTTGVDQASQDDFYLLLRKLNRQLGLTLILITHDVERVVNEAMHIACIDHTLVCHSSPAEFLQSVHSTNLLGREVKILPHHHKL